MPESDFSQKITGLVLNFSKIKLNGFQKFYYKYLYFSANFALAFEDVVFWPFLVDP